ncbi:hypothetical protein [Acidithiobacillus ferriphilus]|uniref:hypothetical protein n=1 Tax=Acidithiobacillus ferriphilus TaxID=1689834 RepID=UPI004055B2E8
MVIVKKIESRSLGLKKISTIEEFIASVRGFKSSYADDWALWIKPTGDDVARRKDIFIGIMRGWSACRPAKANSEFSDREFEYLQEKGRELEGLYLRRIGQNDDIFTKLEELFKAINGICKNKSINMMVASKAIMLVTEGSIGPAFDSNIMKNLGYKYNYDKSFQMWENMLRYVADDLIGFQKRFKVDDIYELLPDDLRSIKLGRLYDMALGPRQNEELQVVTKP